MARGRAPGYDAQRETILAQAAELFARQGFVGTSMNQVATACGMSKPALYHYVRDKSQLLFEIATTHVARLHDLVAEVDRAQAVSGLPADPTQRVRRLIEHFVLEYAGARHAHRVLTEDVKFLEPADQARVLELQRQVVVAFAQAVADARPELVAAHLHKPLAMLLFGMMNWMFTWLQPDGALSHADMAPVVADLFLGGLGAVKIQKNPASLDSLAGLAAESR
ncbi:MAG: TetR/AcrR family transcriptional regulator [Burkholderiaceae bacterium]|nr:TetR/AcrR family transcriptional regulator [Burkholderiaceae bacterium]